MSFLNIEGFELYPNITNTSSTDMARQWSGNYMDIISTGARTGSKCGRFNVATHRIQRFLTAGEEHATIIMGAAVWRLGATDVSVMNFLSDTHVTVHITITIQANGAIRVNRGNSAGTLLGTTAVGIIGTLAWSYLEVKVTLSDTVGVVVIYLDGVQVLNLTAQDTKNAGTKTVIDGMELGFTAGSTGLMLDDIYILNGDATAPNDFLGPCRVRTLRPSANGATSNGTGSDADSTNNYLLVQDTTPSTGTATYVDLAATNDEDTYAFDDLPDVTGTVAAVQTTTYAQKTDASARNLAHVIRITGTDYISADQTLTTSFAWQVTRRTTSPATSTAFTRAEVNAAEYGVRAR